MTTFISELVLPEAEELLLRKHGEETYPEEACGFLIGPAPSSGTSPRRVEQIVRAENEKREERTHRFLVNPAQFRRLEQECEAQGKSILGIYHSHPDHPAEPSTFDLEHAWPWYAYVLVGVERGTAVRVNAFELDPEGAGWQPRPIRRPPSSPHNGGTHE
ncbi:MAG: M67 family metallopeptidase [Candidatus Thermoplasmatota archaeon]|jgi:proteasome lid subunit RPN8/RPN11|nr:M67 family metallopeptidase [Candidatus Thermoplasmatota archaeon]